MCSLSPHASFLIHNQARNREHKHEWTQQLKRLILENYSAEIPPHARQLVMELGRAKQDGQSDTLVFLIRLVHRLLYFFNIVAIVLLR